MARNRTVADMKEDISDLLDVPPFSASTFVSDATILRWLNQAAFRYVSMLIRAYGEDYFSSKDTFDTVAQQDAYDLPDDYYQTQFLRTEIAGTTWKIRRGSRESIDQSRRGQPGWSIGYGPVYRIIGNQLVFAPVPLSQHEVRHHYIANTFFEDTGGTPQSRLILDTDEINGWNGWEQWIVLSVCKTHRMVEEKDPMLFMQEMQSYELEITDDAGRRDGEPKRVKNTYDVTDGLRLGDRFR